MEEKKTEKGGVKVDNVGAMGDIDAGISVNTPAKSNAVNRILWLSAIVGVLFVGGIGVLGYGVYKSGVWDNISWNGSNGSDNDIYYEGGITDGDSTSVAEIAEKVSPSVVSIMTSVRTTSWMGTTSSATAAGTGIVISKDGYILTNKHVVSGATSYKIVMDNGDSYTNVTLVGVDPLNDVAFLKINGVSDLKPATFADSKTLKVGQPVMAIGNALGQYQNTITTGIVSGLGRSITASDSDGNSERLTDMIQTDAAINQGNSGGPLVDGNGNVVGMNTAVSVSANGIGFAIPSSVFKGMMTTVVKEGKAERAYLGVSYIMITPDVAKENNLSVKAGGWVTGDNPIVSGSPADKAGIKANDIILSVNGVEVGVKGSVGALLGEYTVGTEVELEILSGSKEKTVTVKLEAYPGN